MNQFKNQQIIKALAFVFVYSLVLWRVFAISMDASNRGRDFTHGDSYSDRNTYSAAMYFYDYGFSKSKFLPVWDYKGDSAKAGGAYTHYPSLPDILASVSANIFHSKNDRIIRFFPVILSLFWFHFSFLSFCKLC